MTKSELVLQYIRTLVWPLILLLIIFAYHEQVSSLLQGDIEVEIFGVTIKGKQASGLGELQKEAERLNLTIDSLNVKVVRVDSFNTALISENEKLTKLLEDQNAQIELARSSGRLGEIALANIPVEQSQSLVSKSKQLSADLQQQVDQTLKISSKNKFESAKELELRGFNNLLDGQFHEAMRNFEQASRIYPSYHNVDEIFKLLRRKQRELANETTRQQALNELYKEILEKYSWGMPRPVKEKLKETVG